MRLPEQLMMRELAHGHGAKGMAFYIYEDVDGLGGERRHRVFTHMPCLTYTLQSV